MIGVRVGKRCDGTATVGYSINPSESHEAMRATYEGLEAAFFGVFHKLKVCAERKLGAAEFLVVKIHREERYRRLERSRRLRGGRSVGLIRN